MTIALTEIATAQWLPPTHQAASLDPVAHVVAETAQGASLTVAPTLSLAQLFVQSTQSQQLDSAAAVAAAAAAAGAPAQAAEAEHCAAGAAAHAVPAAEPSTGSPGFAGL